MKKISMILIVIFLLIFAVSCGDDSGDSGNTGDTGNTGNTGTDADVVSDDDSGNTGDDTDTGNTGDTAECTGISFDNLSLIAGYDQYRGITTEQTGDPTLDDLVYIQFYKEDYSEITELTPGTYDLATGLNTNYGTCLECVLLYEDWDGGAFTKTYFQESGTLTISKIKKGTIESKGTVTAKLIEVTIDSETFESTPVEGGECYEIETGAWDNICVPACEGKICGNDGCGGICGDGCSNVDQGCNAEGTACVDFECTAITIDAVELVDVMQEEPYWSYKAAYEPSTGEAIADEILVQLFAAPEPSDSFDLAGTNYADNDQRILALEDPVYNGSGTMTALGKTYFQQKGTISFDSFDPVTGKTAATITNLRFVEVTIESGTYISTPVDGGTCLELATGIIEVK